MLAAVTLPHRLTVSQALKLPAETIGKMLPSECDPTYARAIGRAVTERIGRIGREDLLLRWTVGAIAVRLPRIRGEAVVESFAEEIGWAHRKTLVYECARVAKLWPTIDEFRTWVDAFTLRDATGVLIPATWSDVQRQIGAHTDPSIIGDEAFQNRKARQVENAADALEQIADDEIRRGLAMRFAEALSAWQAGSIDYEQVQQSWARYVRSCPSEVSGCEPPSVPVVVDSAYPILSFPVGANEAKEWEHASPRTLFKMWATFMAKTLTGNRDAQWLLNNL